MKIIRFVLLLLTAVFFALPSWAEDASEHEGFAVVFLAGATQGGDSLAKFDYYQYRDNQRDDIDAGDGGYAAIGVAYTFSAPIQLQLTAGFHSTGIAANNGSVHFSRIPVELMSFFHIGSRHRLGIGATAHVGNELEADLDAFVVDGVAYPEVKYELGMKDTIGATIQYDYQIPFANIRIGARATYMEYEWEDNQNTANFDDEINGHYAGLTLQYDLNF